MKKVIIPIIESEMLNIGAIKASKSLYYYRTKNNLVNIIVDVNFDSRRKRVVFNTAFDLNLNLENAVVLFDNKQFIFDINDILVLDKAIKEFLPDVLNDFSQKIEKYEDINNVILFFENAKFPDIWYDYYLYVLFVLLNRQEKLQLLKKKILSRESISPWMADLLKEVEIMDINRANNIVLLNSNKFG